MTVTVTYTCDRCHTSIEKSSDRFQVGLMVSNPNSSLPSYSTPNIRRADWCLACLTECGIFSNPTPNPAVAPPSLSDQLEDIIRSIVQDEMEK